METGLLPFEHLEVMDDPTPREGALNMAIDEILLRRLRGGALLRLYRWAEPSVSLGYFERCNVAKRLAGGRVVVRRWTGGGIVEHGDDLTYSLIVPRLAEFAKLRGAESYRLIHEAIAQALDRIGCVARSHGGLPHDRNAGPRSHACFENPVPYDLLSSGRKVAGAAQRRTRDGLLHQGSIQLVAPDPDRHRDGPSSLWTILPSVFGLQQISRALAADELMAASDLAASKYAATEWVERF